jgi:STAS domain-containing protein
MATETVTLDCARIGDEGLAAIERIARMRLAARRRGRSLVLRNPSAELLELIELSGLWACLGVEVQRKPEQRK